MIYLLRNEIKSAAMEIEFFPAENIVNFQIFNLDTDSSFCIDLNKQDVFKLIGVLHLLNKEME
jgi:hypothetical protein